MDKVPRRLKPIGLRLESQPERPALRDVEGRCATQKRPRTEVEEYKAD
jgi:hypothetical protein